MLGRLAAVTLLTAGCTGPVTVLDPLATVQNDQVSARQHLGAMQQLDGRPDDPEYLKALHGMIWRPRFRIQVREAAFERLARHDEESLKRTCRQQLPRINQWDWLVRLCALIADHGWVELSPALASSWARPADVDDLERPEYQALSQLHGEERVVDVVFEIMVEARKAYQQGLRTRCWTLLDRLGKRDRLIELLQEQSTVDDPMLADLRAAAVELGLVPRNREEILWLRKLREPSRSEFWSRATAVVKTLPAERGRELEVRDLPILVAASIHAPELLVASKSELLARLQAHVLTGRVHVNARRFEGWPGQYNQRLHEQRPNLTWGDLAAMLLAVRAVRVPQVADHLFDYAERDRADQSCEYGGVIALDGKGRFEILEFPPRFRRHDNEFIASQAMLDVGYTALFHFHNHAQRYANNDHAGPGIGDVQYADNTRANCLVFTFVNRNTLNVDFYRHDRVIVDLGEVKRGNAETQKR